MDSVKYSIISQDNNEKFEMDQKFMNASMLLKNISDITKITESILIKCSSKCLKIYMKLIEHYENIDGYDAKFETELYKDFTDEELVHLLQEICILDSDIFLNSVADYILRKIEKMNWKEMQEYFEMEDDFSFEERKIIDENHLEYLLSINLESLKFPFPDKDFVSLKNKFYTPLNAFLARIIQRSRKEIAFNLSMINKTIKNETDRHPIKVSTFDVISERWILIIETLGGKSMIITKKQYGEKYFDVIKKRKLYTSTCRLMYEYKDLESKAELERISSLDFVIPEKIITTDWRGGHVSTYFYTIYVSFVGKNEEVFSFFNVSKCPFSSISYTFNTSTLKNLNFNEIYNKLVKNGIDKEIRLNGSFVDLMPPMNFGFQKNPNSIKFCRFCTRFKNREFPPEIMEFIKTFVEDDAIIDISC